MFGHRLNGNFYVPQPWCKSCRKAERKQSESTTTISKPKQASSIATKTSSDNTRSTSSKRSKETMAEKRARLKVAAQNARKKGKAVIASMIILMLSLCLSASVSAKTIDMQAVDPEGNPITVQVEVGDVQQVKNDLASKCQRQFRRVTTDHPVLWWLTKTSTKAACWGITIALQALK